MVKGRRQSEDSWTASSLGPGAGPFKLKHNCTGHTGAVSAVRFSPDGQLLASVSADKTLKVWNVSDGSLQEPPGSANGAEAEQAPASSSKQAEDSNQQQQHVAGINDVAWNCNSRYLATASDDLTAKIWDVETRKCLATYEGHTNYVFCCQFNPQSTILVSPQLRVQWHAMQRGTACMCFVCLAFGAWQSCAQRSSVAEQGGGLMQPAAVLSLFAASRQLNIA